MKHQRHIALKLSSDEYMSHDRLSDFDALPEDDNVRLQQVYACEHVLGRKFVSNGREYKSGSVVIVQCGAYDFGLVEAVAVLGGSASLLLILLESDYEQHKNMYLVRRTGVRRTVMLSALKDQTPLQIWRINGLECVILK